MNFLTKCMVLSLLLGLGASSASSVKISKISLPNELTSEQLKRPVEILLAKTISTQVVQLLTTRLPLYLNQTATAPRAPLIPPIEDPLVLQPEYFPIDVPTEIFTICGYFGWTAERQITGLGQLVDKLTLTGGIISPLNIHLEVELPGAAVDGEYIMDLVLDLGSIHDIKGEGRLAASVSDVFLDAKIVVRTLTPLLEVLSVDLDLGFKNLKIDGGQATIDGHEIDWTSVGDNLQHWFDTNWNAETRPIYNAMITCVAYSALGGCSLADVVDGNLECINLEIPPTCFMPEGEVQRQIRQDPVCPVAPTLPTDPTASTLPPTSNTPPYTTSPTAPTLPSSTTTTTEQTGSTFDPIFFTCDNKTDGSYGHPTDCSMFIVCTDGEMDTYGCPPPLLFDPIIENCNLPHLVDCDLSCTDKEDGQYPHPHDCSLFLICYGGTVNVYKCPPPLLFDPVEARCANPDTTECPQK